MRGLSIWLLALAVLGGVMLAGRALAADGQDNPPPPPNQKDGPGGPGTGPGGAGGPPPGGVHLIPRFAASKLNLTDDQKKQIADLEKDVKEKLAKILTPEQMKTLEEARPPAGPGGQGGRGQGGGQRGQGGGQGGPGAPPGGGGGNPSGQRPQGPPPSN